MKRLFETYFIGLMPLYLNGRLGGLPRRLFEAWLQRSPSAQNRLENLQILRHAAAAGQEAPSGTVWSRIRAEIQSPAASAAPVRRGTLQLGLGMAVLLILLGWFAFPPSVVLEWSIQGAPPEAFYIYRSTPGSQDFRLVEEVPVVEAQLAYRFVDLRLLPVGQATYKIEAIGDRGTAVTSELVVPDGGIALPNQLALLLSIGVLVYGVFVAISMRNGSQLPGAPLRAS